MIDFYNNKIIWITGASSGIGRALVDVLSNFDTTIIISSRNEVDLKCLQNILIKRRAKIHVFSFDLNNISEFPNYVDNIIQNFGRIDILFNNGGLSQRSLAIETPIEIDRKLMEVNYFSNIQLSKSILPFMINQKSGNIVVTSSISGKFGFYFRSGYAASKHALHGFYESLYLENMKFGINITMVCPGSIKTNIAKNALLKDGSASNSSENRLEQGMNPNLCAKKIIVAVSKNKKEVIIGGKEILPVYIKRFLPSFFWWIIQRVKP